jgi:hypothetical protein
MDHNLIMDQVTTSAIVVYLLQWMKASRWPPLTWVNQNSARWLALAASGATALGLQFTWNPNTRVIALVVPTLAGFLLMLVHAGSHWLRAHVFQELIYNGVAKPSTTAAALVSAEASAKTKAEAAAQDAKQPEVSPASDAKP